MSYVIKVRQRHVPVAVEDSGSLSYEPVELASPLASAIKYSIATSESPRTSRKTCTSIVVIKRWIWIETALQTGMVCSGLHIQDSALKKLKLQVGHLDVLHSYIYKQDADYLNLPLELQSHLCNHSIASLLRLLLPRIACFSVFRCPSLVVAGWLEQHHPSITKALTLSIFRMKIKHARHG